MIVGFGGFSAEEVDDVDSFLFLFLDQNDIFFGIQRERQQARRHGFFDLEFQRKSSVSRHCQQVRIDVERELKVEWGKGVFRGVHKAMQGVIQYAEKAGRGKDGGRYRDPWVRIKFTFMY